jgi:hypothetical protein
LSRGKSSRSKCLVPRFPEGSKRCRLHRVCRRSESGKSTLVIKITV